MTEEKYLGEERVSEFWIAIKALVSAKLTEALKNYATDDAVVTAIYVALTDYVQTGDMNSAISTALKNYMPSEQITELIEKTISEISTVSFKIEDILPEIGKSNIIYLIPSSDPREKNVKDEYLWIDGAWEKIGNTSVDLSQYWSKEELREMTKEELKEILV